MNQEPIWQEPGCVGACCKGSDISYECLLSLGPKDFSASVEGQKHKEARAGPSEGQVQGRTASHLASRWAQDELSSLLGESCRRSFRAEFVGAPDLASKKLLGTAIPQWIF